MFVSCMDIADRKTSLLIVDNDRHYFPVLAGQKKELSFVLKNTGSNPLIIKEIITSCGCLAVEDEFGAFSVPPGQERTLNLTYNSAKNIGFVKHYISLYGNFDDAPMKEIMFDIHVVPDAMYTKDYEELYNDEIKAEGGVKTMVDGSNENKGYYLNEDLKIK